MSDEPNEILAAALEAKARREAAEAAEAAARERRWQIGQIGLGVGIGSAALAAALLFVNRDKKS